MNAEPTRLEGIAKPLTAVGSAVRSGATRAGAAGRRAGQAVRPHAPRST